MKRVSEPGAFLVFDGRLARVVGIAEGRTIHMQFVEEDPCPACGHQPGADVLEHSPLFQKGAEAVPTI
jgi:hypothetical protein